MPRKAKKPQNFNIFVVGQAGRLQYEALLFAASLRRQSPGFKGRLFIAEPQPGPLWQQDPRIKNQAVREALAELDAEILPFENLHFGQSYPYGNKIEALAALPDEPFVFFDTDTLITGELTKIPFDFTRPTASLRRENTWPKEELYGPTVGETWASLYKKFGLDFDAAQDKSQPENYWQRYPYYNAGFFFHESPAAFGKTFLEYAVAIRDDAPRELVCQPLDPWLDQVALPLAIHAHGGGPGTLPDGMLDGTHSCHYRFFPLLYARESERTVTLLEETCAPNKIKKVLKEYEPIKRMVYQGRGQKVRALFDQNDLPRKEQAIRNKIKREGFWMR